MTGREDWAWRDLDEAQAAGRACVICARDVDTSGDGAVPVGWSHTTGSQVFACVGACHGRAIAKVKGWGGEQ